MKPKTMQSNAESDTSKLIDNAGDAYERGDLSLAGKLYLEAAKSGDAEAATFVGWMYETGSGMDKNLDEAATWYRFASDSSNLEASFYLGQLLEKLGRCDEAALYYEKAARAGHLQSAYRLGAFYTRFQSDGQRWLTFAAENGHAFAIALLGRRMFRGVWPGGRFKGLYLMVKSVFLALRIAFKTKETNIVDDPKLAR